MTADFPTDLEALLADLSGARADLVATVQTLADGDLERARRGGWPVRRVLDHVIQSEYLYANLVCRLRGVPIPQRAALSREGQAPDELLCELDDSRTALLSALDGVEEDRLYSPQALGDRQFSVLGVAQHAAEHDHEHAAQIRGILAAC